MGKPRPASDQPHSGLKVESRRSRGLRGAPSPGSHKTVYVALAGNITVAVSKFVAAWFTGSAAMLSEGAHSLVDSANEGLLIHGMRRAAQPPDLDHPLGHGREAYFWSFIVALLFFLLGAVVSCYEGVEHLLHPEPIKYAFASYAVIGIAVLCEGYSLSVAVREFSAEKGELGYIDAIQRSKNPSTFTILLEDSAALLGLAVALLGILGAHLLHIPELDGAASIGIGLILGAMAIFLAYETKGLLIGEQASPALEAAILTIASEDPAVRSANGVITVHLGPDQIVAELSVEFDPKADAAEIEDSVERIEKRIQARHPEIATLFVKPQSAETWALRQQRIESASDPELRVRASRRRALRERLRSAGRRPGRAGEAGSP